MWSETWTMRTANNLAYFLCLLALAFARAQELDCIGDACTIGEQLQAGLEGVDLGGIVDPCIGQECNIVGDATGGIPACAGDACGGILQADAGCVGPDCGSSGDCIGLDCLGGFQTTGDLGCLGGDCGGGGAAVETIQVGGDVGCVGLGCGGCVGGDCGGAGCTGLGCDGLTQTVQEGVGAGCVGGDCGGATECIGLGCGGAVVPAGTVTTNVGENCVGEACGIAGTGLSNPRVITEVPTATIPRAAGGKPVPPMFNPAIVSIMPYIPPNMRKAMAGGGGGQIVTPASTPMKTPVAPPVVNIPGVNTNSGAANESTGAGGPMAGTAGEQGMKGDVANTAPTTSAILMNKAASGMKFAGFTASFFISFFAFF
ncbi:hypothetical protein BC830DRAFT_646172 [Chytriomyces sp. MP71]|nr:hypothetical protein BC830DRAFT_646172 [Chytriomyces sp. MP71]